MCIVCRLHCRRSFRWSFGERCGVVAQERVSRMNRSVVRRQPDIGLALAMVACDHHDAARDRCDVGRRGRAVEADESGEQGFALPPLASGLSNGCRQDKLPDSEFPLVRIPEWYVRPEEKVLLPSWLGEFSTREDANREDAELANVEQAPLPATI